MRDDENRVALGVKLAQQVDDELLVGFVEVAGGLVGKNQLRMIDERAGNGHALLLATGKLRRKMGDASGEAHAAEGFAGFGLVGHAVKILREHDVFERGEIGHEMELLKDETDFVGAIAGERALVKRGDVGAVHHGAAGAGAVEAAEDVDERGLAGAGGAHDGDPLAGVHGKRDLIERADSAEFFGEFFDLHKRGHHSPLRISAGRT